MSAQLPAWPKKPQVSALGSQFTLEEMIRVAGHEYARAEAAIARLRVLRSAILDAIDEIDGDCPISATHCLQESLSAIGPLPGEAM